MTGGRVLVAGVGNIFLGDDAFGVEVIRRLDRSAFPPNVDVTDYGIRGVHLAYELLDGRHDALVLVDAVAMDEPPGTLAVLDVTPADVPPARIPAVDAHGMSPAAVLALLDGLGARVDRVLVVACQPAELGEAMELSAPVAAAVERAVTLVADVVGRLVLAPPGEEVASRA